MKRCEVMISSEILPCTCAIAYPQDAEVNPAGATKQKHDIKKDHFRSQKTDK